MKKLLKKNYILRQSDSCVMRIQEQQYFIYNTKTDEMYLLPPVAFYVLQLCNGLNTVGELEDVLCDFFVVSSEVAKIKLNEFLRSLLDRKIVELW